MQLSEQENAEETAMMKQAVNELFGEDSVATEKLLDRDMRENRLYLLRKQLVGPEIEQVNARLDLKITMLNDDLKKMIEREVKRLDYNVNSKINAIDEMLY